MSFVIGRMFDTVRAVFAVPLLRDSVAATTSAYLYLDLPHEASSLSLSEQRVCCFETIAFQFAVGQYEEAVMRPGLNQSHIRMVSLLSAVAKPQSQEMDVPAKEISTGFTTVFCCRQQGGNIDAVVQDSGTRDFLPTSGRVILAGRFTAASSEQEPLCDRDRSAC